MEREGEVKHDAAQNRIRTIGSLSVAASLSSTLFWTKALLLRNELGKALGEE